MTIQVSLSEAFINKDFVNGYGESAYATSFMAQTVSVPDFIKHILDGKAWAVGTYQGNHRTKHKFIQSQILALDFDADANLSVSDAIQYADIGDYAALVHPSPTSSLQTPKTRVVFILDRPIPDKAKWNKAALAMLDHFQDLKPDTSCKDCSRFFFGSTNHTAPYYDKPEQRLSLEVVAQWVKRSEQTRQEEEKQLQEAPGKPASNVGHDERSRHAQAVYNKLLERLATCTEGERNDTLNRTAFFLFGCVRGAWPGIDAMRAKMDLTRIGRMIGLAENEVEKTIHSAETSAIPIEQEIKQTDKGFIIPDLSKWEPGNADDVIKFQSATMGELNTTLRALAIAAKSQTIGHDQLTAMADHAYAAIDKLMIQAGHVQPVSATSAIRVSAQLVNERMNKPGMVIGLQSGIQSLDYGLGGFASGSSYTFLAETGVGKTALAVSLMAAFAQQTPGLIISCENDEIILGVRLQAYFSHIPFSCLLHGGTFQTIQGTVKGFNPFDASERDTIRTAQSRALQITENSLIEHHPAPTPMMIRTIARNNAGKIGWIILDSLNNISLPYQSTEYERVSQAALLCEELALTFKISVISTVQGGRNTKGRADKRLQIHDARGSGLVEEKASGLITMYNHWYLVNQEIIEEKPGDDVAYPVDTVRMHVRKLRAGIAGQKFNVKYLGGCGFYND